MAKIITFLLVFYLPIFYMGTSCIYKNKQKRNLKKHISLICKDIDTTSGIDSTVLDIDIIVTEDKKVWMEYVNGYGNENEIESKYNLIDGINCPPTTGNHHTILLKHFDGSPEDLIVLRHEITHVVMDLFTDCRVDIPSHDEFFLACIDYLETQALVVK